MLRAKAFLLRSILARLPTAFTCPLRLSVEPLAHLNDCDRLVQNSATLANIFQPHSSNQLGLDVALLKMHAAMDAKTTLPLSAPDVR